MTIQVYQRSITHRLRSPFTPRRNVMALQRLSVDQIHSAYRAVPVLTVGEFNITDAEVAQVDLLPRPPVFPEARVVRRRCTTHRDVTFDLEPTELQQVTARAFVSKHPVVVPLGV